MARVTHLTESEVARVRLAAAVMSACLILLSSPILAQTGAIQHVHDPAIIAAEGKFYVFSTGMGIPVRMSSDLVR